MTPGILLLTLAKFTWTNYIQIVFHESRQQCGLIQHDCLSSAIFAKSRVLRASEILLLSIDHEEEMIDQESSHQIEADIHLNPSMSS